VGGGAPEADDNARQTRRGWRVADGDRDGAWWWTVWTGTARSGRCRGRGQSRHNALRDPTVGVDADDSRSYG